MLIKGTLEQNIEYKNSFKTHFLRWKYMKFEENIYGV